MDRADLLESVAGSHTGAVDGLIAAVELQSTRIATSRPHQMAIGTTNFQEDVIVKIATPGGTVGFGESPFMVGHSQKGETPATVRVVLRHKLLPAVLGLSVFDQEALSRAMDRAVPGNLRAKGAVVMAAYDAAGKLLGTPVHNLIGGLYRDRIPLSWSLPISDLDHITREAADMVERGWRILKVKIGRPDPFADADAVNAIRRTVGDEIEIRADANQAYDVKTAIRVIRRMEDASLGFIEQPVKAADVAGMAEVRAAVDVPIMADEGANDAEDVFELARHRAADSISIYIIGPGGLNRSRKMASVTEACGLRGYVGGALESAIGATAGLHLAAASPAIDLGCEMSGQFLLNDDFGAGQIAMADGALVVPRGPGLGVDVDEDKLVRYREGDVERFTLNGAG
jgi:muconate/chloromuconate cycloisomerase